MLWHFYCSPINVFVLWLSGYGSWFQAPPMPACRYMEEIGSAAMLAVKRSAGVTLEVNLWVSVTHMPLPSVSKAAHSGFEAQRRCHPKSKTGVPLEFFVTFTEFSEFREPDNH